MPPFELPGGERSTIRTDRNGRAGGGEGGRWLLAARCNLSLDHSLLRRAGVEARFLARTRAEPVPPPGDEQAMVLWQAVQGLPSRQRAVLVLRFHEDLAEAEVARLLGLPLGTVKSLAHRGLARLRDQLGSPGPSRSPGQAGRSGGAGGAGPGPLAPAGSRHRGAGHHRGPPKAVTAPYPPTQVVST
jgi:hypothetical protein